ncbi:MAG TPA: hypothetical protein VK703_02250 [Candidatus Acidoferrales bacterium]|jgi:hypothetical protein|nr:hypothetical protein [Candidatus Acidoferrales bacterium]
MTDAASIARWIQDLAGSDARLKSESGMRLYLAGVNLCTPLLSRWVSDPEFRNLTLPGAPADATHARFGPSAIVVGIAVQPETFQKIRIANNSPRLAHVPTDQDAQEFELHLDASTEFDILTTSEPGGRGAISRFLQKFGEGIQQIEIYVRDVDRATEILRTRFTQEPLYPATRPGADGTRVNFFLATGPDAKKVLIELVEAAR